MPMGAKKFYSNATDLVANDTNSTTDVFCATG